MVNFLKKEIEKMFNNDYIKEAFIQMRNTLAISHTLKAIDLE